jgi:ABC-type hemin transport system ATPase subunit
VLHARGAWQGREEHHKGVIRPGALADLWAVGARLHDDDPFDWANAVCDGCTVLDRGQVIADGGPHRVLSDPAVQTAYLGVVPVAGEQV